MNCLYKQNTAYISQNCMSVNYLPCLTSPCPYNLFINYDTYVKYATIKKNTELFFLFFTNPSSYGPGNLTVTDEVVVSACLALYLDSEHILTESLDILDVFCTALMYAVCDIFLTF